MAPRRIQRRREKGWRLPDGAVCVTRPGKWGNPFRVGQSVIAVEDDGSSTVRYVTAEEAVEAYRAALTTGRGGMYGMRVTAEDAVRELAGRTLACWCPEGTPCHGDVLLAVANEASR